MKNNIRIEKFISKYEKGKFIDTYRVDLSYTSDVETAKKIIKNYDLHYVKDNKNISLYESVKATYWDDDKTIKILFKEIDTEKLTTWDNIGD